MEKRNPDKQSTAQCIARPEEQSQEMSLEEAKEYLDRLGVPRDLKWRILILYLRSLAEYPYLSNQQKQELQQLILNLLSSKEFTEQTYQKILDKKGEILFTPYKIKLRESYAEISKLLKSFHDMYLNRKNDVQGLKEFTLDVFENEDDLDKAIPRLKNAFEDIIKGMEEDAKELYRQTRIDELTQLYNRKALNEILYKTVSRAMHNNQPVCMAMLDLDHFKDLNDTYGHRIGDQALATVAKILKEQSKKHQGNNELGFIPARYGGEEFVVVFPDTDKSKAFEVTEAIRERIQNYNFIIRNSKGEVLEQGIKLTVSAGVAEIDLNSESDPGIQLLEMADKTMYQAKKNGRNQVCISSKNC